MDDNEIKGIREKYLRSVGRYLGHGDINIHKNHLGWYCCGYLVPGQTIRYLHPDGGWNTVMSSDLSTREHPYPGYHPTRESVESVLAAWLRPQLKEKTGFLPILQGESPISQEYHDKRSRAVVTTLSPSR